MPSDFNAMVGCCETVALDERLTEECGDGGEDIFDECERACEAHG